MTQPGRSETIDRVKLENCKSWKSRYERHEQNMGPAILGQSSAAAFWHFAGRFHLPTVWSLHRFQAERQVLADPWIRLNASAPAQGLITMKTILSAAVLAALLLHASAADTNRALSSIDAKRISTAVNAGTSPSRFYNANGSPAGRSQASGDTTRFYQANGASSGRSQESGKTVYFYDASGRSEGRAQKNGNTTTFYDSNGRSASRAATSGGVATFFDASGRSAGRASSSKNSTEIYNSNGSSKGRISRQ